MSTGIHKGIGVLFFINNRSDIIQMVLDDTFHTAPAGDTSERKQHTPPYVQYSFYCFYNADFGTGVFR